MPLGWCWTEAGRPVEGGVALVSFWFGQEREKWPVGATWADTEASPTLPKAALGGLGGWAVLVLLVAPT